jgi:hypothetical protein
MRIRCRCVQDDFQVDLSIFFQFSPILLLDLERAYLLPDLCDSIAKFEVFTAQNFGEIHQVAKRIGSESLERDIYRTWMLKSDSFNDNEDQIKTLIRDFDNI